MSAPTTPEAKIPIAFLFFECPDCGAVYGITERCFDKRTRDGRAIYCPNGHELHVTRDGTGESPIVEAERLRGELIQVRHQLEQTEAKLSAAEPPAEKPDPLQCPYCARRFKSMLWARRHVARMHGDQLTGDR